MNNSIKIFTSLLLVAYFISGCGASKNIQFECPKIKSDLSGLKSNDLLVLDGDGTYLMDMNTLAMTPMNKPNEGLYYFASSPKHNWIAYISNVSNDLVVAGADNKVINAMPWDDDWAYVDWLNEEQLIIPLIQKDQMSDVSGYLVLNPFTDERYILSADYPEMFYDEPWRIIEYNPKIDSVVYLQGGVSGPFDYTLWDIQNKTALAQLDANGDLHTFPRWSSDGSQFAIALSLSLKMGAFPSYEIFQVSRGGKSTQLTHLSDY